MLWSDKSSMCTNVTTTISRHMTLYSLWKVWSRWNDPQGHVQTQLRALSERSHVVTMTLSCIVSNDFSTIITVNDITQKMSSATTVRWLLVAISSIRSSFQGTDHEDVPNTEKTITPTMTQLHRQHITCYKCRMISTHVKCEYVLFTKCRHTMV